VSREAPEGRDEAANPSEFNAEICDELDESFCHDLERVRVPVDLSEQTAKLYHDGLFPLLVFCWEDGRPILSDTITLFLPRSAGEVRPGRRFGHRRPKAAVFEQCCGRYWDRTSDLFGVNGA
jgi:hypothetical protein